MVSRPPVIPVVVIVEIVLKWFSVIIVSDKFVTVMDSLMLLSSLSVPVMLIELLFTVTFLNANLIRLCLVGFGILFMLV